jgi:peptide deformylase
MYRKPLTVIRDRLALRKKSETMRIAPEWTDADRDDIKDLTDTFNVLQGHGLALPQIGIRKRAIVVNMESLGISGYSEPEVMINPTLELYGQEQRNEEACFSVPHISAMVRRPNSCTVSYSTTSGEEKQIQLDGFAAACIQHEVDHLDGILYIDRAGRVYSGMLMKKCLKAEARLQKQREEARIEFEKDRRDIYGIAEKKTTSSKKRVKKPRKKRPIRSKKRK